MGTRWLKHLAKAGIYILAMLLLIIICLPCVLQCVQRLIAKSTKKILLVDKKGGDVEMQLESRSESTAKLMSEVDALMLLGCKPWQAVRPIMK